MIAECLPFAETWFEIIAGSATFFGILLILHQVRQARLTSNADMSFRFSQMWLGEQMMKYQGYLREKNWERLSKEVRKDLYDNERQVYEAVTCIANFFEQLGSAAKYGGLDLRFVLPFFGGLIQVYWNQLHEVMEEAMEERYPDPRFMEHFRWLNEECKKREPLPLEET